MNPTPVIVQRCIETGIGFTSKIVATGSAGLSGTSSDINIWHGFGYGFMIVPDASVNHSQYMMVRIRGVGKISNDVNIIIPNTWYDCPFDSLDFTVLDRNDPNEHTFGTYVVNIATKPYARILPVSPSPDIWQYPSALGGTPDTTDFNDTLDATTTPPTTSTQGYLIPVGVSTWAFQVDAGSGDTVSGGTVDVYTLSTSGADQWVLIAQGYALPTGSRVVQISDKFGIRSVGGESITRVFFALNAVTNGLGGATQFDTYTVFQ
jgi:hypothetical protein